MNIEQLLIANYRSWKSLLLDLNPNEPNVFIGLNDCGKSTILHSLDLLLSKKPKYFSKSDGSNKCDLSNSVLSEADLTKILEEQGLPAINYSGSETIIFGCLKFTEEELEEWKELTLTPTLQWAIENSRYNKIWLARSFSNTQQNTFLLVKDADDAELWNAKAADLTSKQKDLEVTKEEIQNENGKGRFSNFEKLRAIYKKLDLKDRWANYRSGKQDLEAFPEFSYYDWNCSFEDINSLASSIMKEHIDEHIGPIKKSAAEAANKAEELVNKKFSELAKQIKEIAKGVSDIKSKVHFDVKESISDIMVVKDNSDGEIHLDLQGEGLKRQIWFSLIKAKADKSVKSESKKFIWAFDEPETHLYPGAQRELFDVISTLSEGNVQSIISTHSTIFIDRSKISRIGRVELEDHGYSDINYCTDVEDIHDALQVRNSDFLFFDKFLVVEGETEQYLVPKLYTIYTGKKLIDDNIQLINLKGCNKWTQNKEIIDKIVLGFKKNPESIIYLFDNDMSFEIGGDKTTDEMFFVGDQDIEDAIENNIWVEVIKSATDSKLTLSEEEIGIIKTQVPQGHSCGSHEKFYRLLHKEVKRKLGELEGEQITYDVLSSKGSDSADMILKFLTRSEQIPQMIRNAFDKLRA